MARRHSQDGFRRKDTEEGRRQKLPWDGLHPGSSHPDARLPAPAGPSPLTRLPGSVPMDNHRTAWTTPRNHGRPQGLWDKGLVQFMGEWGGTPHGAQNTHPLGGSAIDQRSRSHQGDPQSLHGRRGIEKVSGQGGRGMNSPQQATSSHTLGHGGTTTTPYQHQPPWGKGQRDACTTLIPPIPHSQALL